MNLVDHDNTNDKKVWLSDQEVQQLLQTAKDTERKVAYELAARCGLRSHEILHVSPTDVIETDAGRMLKVEEGKGEKYRETPLPDTVAGQIEAIDDMREASSNVPILSVASTQSLRYWIKTAREQLAEETEDERWHYVSMHDLRRTWASSLSNMNVDPLIVCQWGGWNDLETFLEHYDGAYSPEAQQREREKVEWL